MFSTSPDRRGNPLNTSSVQNELLQVRTYTRDSECPRLVTFSVLDMDEGFLTVLFSEAVEIASLLPENIILQAMQAPIPMPAYTFTGGTPSYTNNLKTEVRLDFNAEDLLRIKLLSGLAASPATSYLSLSTEAIQDTSTNEVVERTPSIALQVVVYVSDQSNPRLVRYTLDMNNGLLALTFE